MTAAGRFAPTPSGPLHFGSLVAALASYADARARGDRWLLRIEDVDTPRVVTGAADSILTDLEHFGFEWDQLSWQSDHFEEYSHHLEALLMQGFCYACECSRRSLRHQGVKQGVLGQIYPSNCRDSNLPNEGHSIRLNTKEAGSIKFNDLVYGMREMHLESEIGDFVLRRADGVYAYHLAVVVDDQREGITRIVRGSDLLENTCLHLWLQHRLDFKTPEYLHLPLVTQTDGAKLSKQTGAQAINPAQASKQLFAALNHLGQKPPEGLDRAPTSEVIQWAVAHWTPGLISDDSANITDLLVD
ncbi:MAG: tRNA glutamyl-Q(34) synthetase GluQRS [Pseudomonadota bacterium]